MDIIISNASNAPIYEQIVRQLKDAILAGELAEGEQLPSIRALANSLRISAITTKRAYADLEAQGFIETVQGKGSFVAAKNGELLREEQLKQIEQKLTEALALARQGGISDAELAEMFQVLLQGE